MFWGFGAMHLKLKGMFPCFGELRAIHLKGMFPLFLGIGAIYVLKECSHVFGNWGNTS